MTDTGLVAPCERFWETIQRKLAADFKWSLVVLKRIGQNRQDSVLILKVCCRSEQAAALSWYAINAVRVLRVCVAFWEDSWHERAICMNFEVQEYAR